MKKFFLSLLTIMYMTVSSGIAIEIHYCMGEKAGVDFYKFTTDKCGRCGMKEQNKKGCCSNDHKFVKIQDSHKQAYNDINFSLAEPAIVTNYALYNWQLPAAISTSFVFNNSPPNCVRPPARILHGVFII